MSQPWVKFYFSDWTSDPKLRMCGLAARGLWMEMLAIMHEAEPYGHLLVSGIVPSEQQLSVLVGAPVQQVADLLVELGIAGVFSRNRAGVIFSRKMVKDEKKAQIARKNGKNGGNPKLCKQTAISTLDNQIATEPVKPPLNTQKPEARVQSLEREERSPIGDPKKTGSRLPDEWRPTPADLAYAAAYGFGPELADDFRDYWTSLAGAKARKTNWTRVWQLWVRRQKPPSLFGRAGPKKPDYDNDPNMRETF